jgi:hypothetical protein
MKNFTKQTAHRSTRLSMATWLVLLSTVACGQMDYDSAPATVTSTREQDLQGENGVTLNGVTLNGVTLNGVTLNGVTLNGVTLNGVTLNGVTLNGLVVTPEFSAWFSQNVTLNAMVMKYLVRCAVPEGETRSYQDAATGTLYTWQGSLGLAPGWSSGKKMNEPEQQLVSACMAAHANKYGLHVPLSVLGRTARGQTIPYSTEELQTFARREACFFGNLFKNEGLFAGTDGEYLNNDESSPRACGLSTQQGEQDSQCSPIVHVNSCETYCTLDPSGLFYTECTYNGRTYLPLTTRIRTDDVYTCGDGVCQFTESCGTGSEANNCMNDCGPCQQ